MNTNNLEQRIAELKAIVSEMESSTIKLERLAELYNKGSILATEISKELKAMRGQIKVLNNDLEDSTEDDDNE